jgi:hypothetical protein
MSDALAMEQLEKARSSIERYLKTRPVTLETLRIADEWFTAIDAALDVLLRGGELEAPGSVDLPAFAIAITAAPSALET